MRVFGVGIGQAPDCRQVAVATRQGAVMMARASMNQIPVLGAANVLHEEHVASARAQKRYHQQRRQGTSALNH